jgi:hypothetical protein
MIERYGKEWRTMFKKQDKKIVTVHGFKIQNFKHGFSRIRRIITDRQMMLCERYQ